MKFPKDLGRESRHIHKPKQIEKIKEPSVDERIASLEGEVKYLREIYSSPLTEFENFQKSFE
jgi:hypothetical protein